MRFILLGLVFVLSLYGKNVKQDPIQRIDLKDGTSVLRIHFNYLDSFENTARIRGIDGMYTINYALPNKWELLEANGYIKYTPSILLLKDLSSAVISFNDVVVDQFKIFDNQDSGIKFAIEPALFYENNKLKFEAIQHYTYDCEDGTHSSLWTDINLEYSYLELHVRPKPIKEMISSIKTDVFDEKQYSVTPLNFVIDKKDDQSLKNYTMFSAIAATNLKYRLEQIKVSNKLDKKNHNFIIGTKEEARKHLLGLSQKYIIDDKPSLSLFFNSNTCNPWLNKSEFATVSADESIKIVKKGALFDKSLYLDGDGVALKDLKVKDTEAVTVAFWFKPKDTKRAKLFSFDSYSLMLFDNYIGFNTANKDLYGAKHKFKDDRWHHISATFHNGAVERNSIVLDGKILHLEQVSGRFVSDNAHLSQNAYIGNSQSDSKMYYKGYIDQFYMFDYALNTMSANKLYKYSKNNKRNRGTESLYLDDKLAHDINVIQNPYQIDKAIIVIAPKDESRQEELVYALYKNDIEKYKRQGLNIKNVTIPEKALAYTSKDFIPLGEKIYFKELGYETRLLKGWYPDKVKLQFKVYPDNYFDEKDKLDTNMHYVLPSVVRDDSVINTYMNGIFANQVDIMDTAEQAKAKISAKKLFDYDSDQDIPSYLIGKGFNELRLDFSLVPLKKGACEVYNTENLVASVLDDSYFILPKAKKWVELPYMQYITSAQYPYSIFPDLQDTVIYLANNHDDTIASAMNFIFFITQGLDSYPNYIRITSNLSSEDKEKNIIVFGSINDEKLQTLSKEAPIVFNKETMKKNYPYVKRFIEHETILNKDRLKKYNFLTSMEETNLVDNSLVMQMFRSEYNTNKTVLMFAANTPSCLDNGVNSILQYKNRHNILGDTVIYDYEEEEGVAYNIKDKYILSDLGWLDTLSLSISANPITYIIFFILLLILFVWIVKLLLSKFKAAHHKDAE